jgi:inositol-phosphate phosphatase / L-galactose 1-phosphate phosphatase / histidinol-phosphatase
MTHCPDDLIALAHRLAEAGGAAARRYYRTPVAVDTKADESPVTIADREAESAIRAILALERPEDGIIGEEHGRERTGASHVWVIDPIDGTKSFLAGRPIFGTLIALFRDGVPILGLIDQPIVHDRWLGAAGRQTTLNGAPCQIRPCPALADAVLATTAPDIFSAAELTRFATLQRATRRTMYGGDCYNYGLMAAGFLDIVLESSMQPHDWAALVPVVEGAGGSISDWSGAPLRLESGRGDVLASGDRRCHAAALELLAEG